MNRVNLLHGYVLCLKNRADHLFSFTWATIIGSLIASKGIPFAIPLISAVTITFCNTAVTYVYNDIMDIEIDRINSLDRAVAQGKISKGQALSLVLFLAVSSLVLSILISMQTFILTTVFLTLAFFYSTPPIYLKRILLSKQVMVGIAGIIATLTSGVVIGNMPPSLFYLASLFFVFSLAGNAIGDLKDIEGDKEKGVRTFVTVFGPVVAIKLGIVVMVTFSVTIILTHPLLGLNMSTPIIISAALALFLWASIPLLKKWNDAKTYLNARRTFVLTLFISQLAMLSGVL